MIVLIINMLTIAAGSFAGVLLRRKIRKTVLDGMMLGIGVVIVYMGAAGINLKAGSVALLLAFAIGSLIGFAADLEGKLDRGTQALEKKLGGEQNHLAGPALNFFVVSCSGAYTVNACFQAGIGNYSMLYTKAILDFIVTLSMSSTMGIGVILACIPTFLFEGSLMLLAGVLAPLMTEGMMAAFASAGCLIAALIGTNMLGATRIPVINMLPAIFLAPFMAAFLETFGL